MPSAPASAAAEYPLKSGANRLKQNNRQQIDENELIEKKSNMINVKVKYKVTPEFSEKNRENIETFLESVRELDHTKFRYQVYVEEVGLTFYHQSAYLNEEIHQQLLAMPKFIEFQRQRD